MRNCGCAGQTCGCLVTGGEGIEVTGSGTASNPFVVVNTASDLASSFEVNDTTTLDLTLAGGGTALDPFILSGVVTLTTDDLTDKGGIAPADGDVITWVGTGPGSHWEWLAGGGGGGSGTVDKYAVNVPAFNPATINHALATLDVVVAVYEISTGNLVFPDVDLTDANNVNLTFAVAPTVGQYRAVVLG